MGRAQGAYDEMVFRSMVRDGSRFYEPPGAGVRGHQDRLPDRDQLLPLRHALHDLPRLPLLPRVRRRVGAPAREGTPGLLRVPVPAGLRPVPRGRLAGLDRLRAGTSRRRTSRRSASTRSPPTKDLSPQPLGSVSRAYVDPETRNALRRVQLPGGGRATSGRSPSTPAAIEQDPRRQGADDLHRHLAGLRPRHPDALLHHRQLRLPRPDDRRPGHRRRRGCCSRTRASAIWSSTAPTAPCGACGTSTASATLVRIPHPYDEWKQDPLLALRRRASTTSTSRPDGRLLSASVGEISGRQSLRVMTLEGLRRRRHHRDRVVRLRGRASPRTSSSRPTAGTCTAAPTTPASPTSSATSSRPGTSRRSATPRPASSARSRSATSGSSSSATPARGSCPPASRPSPLEDVSPITFLGQQIVEKHPVLKEWQVGSPADVPLESLVERPGDVPAPRPASASSRSTRSSRATRTRRRSGLRLNFSDPTALQPAERRAASYTPGQRAAERRALPPPARVRALRLEALASSGTAPTSTTSSARRRRA